MTSHATIKRLIQSLVARDPEFLQEIQCKELDLNEVGTHGRTLLMVAAAENLITEAEALIQNGAAVRASVRFHGTALHEACSHGHARIINLLLSHGAELNAITDQGITPLMCAAAFGNIEATRVLLENGADWDSVDHTGVSAVDIAREKGEDSVADFIDACARQPQSSNSLATRREA